MNLRPELSEPQLLPCLIRGTGADPLHQNLVINSYSDKAPNSELRLIGGTGQRLLGFFFDPQIVQSVTNMSYIGISDGLALPIRTGHHQSCQNSAMPTRDATAQVARIGTTHS